MKNSKESPVTPAKRASNLAEDSDRFLGKRDAALFLGISKSNLESRMNYIPHFRIGKKVLFRKSELLTWMEVNRVPVVDLNKLVDEIIRKIKAPKKKTW